MSSKLTIAVIIIAFVAGIHLGIVLTRREVRLNRAVNNNSANIQRIVNALRPTVAQAPATDQTVE